MDDHKQGKKSAADTPTDEYTIVLSSTDTESTMVHAEPSTAEIVPGIFNKTRRFLFRRRRDVNSVIENLRDHRKENAVMVSETESELEPLEHAYELGEKFAEGGQGILYRAIDKHLERLVAIKSLRPELSALPEQRRGFLTEARVTAQLDHPAIVPIYSLNAGEDRSLHLAMKQIKGETLKEYLDQVKTHYRLDGVHTYDERKALRFRLDIFLKVCDALEYAHNRNIMHRDLKPSNIMIGEYRETYIMDWGIAETIHPAESPTSHEHNAHVCGTPQYLAPEAIQGQAVDQRADLFSMGAILFEIVALKRAFSGATLAELLGNIKNGRMETITHQFGAPIDRDLKAVIRKATAIDPERRYQQISELSSDLRRYLMGLEVSALPDNPITKTIRWIFLHRRLTLTLLIGALVLGIGAMSFAFYREYCFSEQLRQREYAIGIVDSECGYAGYLLDEQFAKVKLMTDLLAADLQFLLEYDPHTAKNAVVTPTAYAIPQLKNNEAGHFIDSEFHRGKIAADAIAYNQTPDTDIATLPYRVNTVARLIPRLLQTILESPRTARVTPENYKELRRNAFANGTPIIRILFGFPDGLYIAYPASGAFPEKYDPRRRPWYRALIQSEGKKAVWTEPYIDSIPQIGLVLSCSVPLHLLGTRGDGICSVDLSLAELIEELNSTGNFGEAVEEKALVDDQGRIMLSTTQSFHDAKLRNFASAEESVTFNRLADPVIFQEIKNRKSGVLTARDHQSQEILYAFYHIQAVNWYYVEKINLQKLLKQYPLAPGTGPDHGLSEEID